MLTSIRKNQQVLMLAIAIMTIVAFIWLYNRTNLNQVGSNDVLSVYGRVVQRADIDRMVRGYQLSLALGLTDFVRELGGMGSDEEKSLNDFILNLLIVQHRASELGIRPSDEAVAGVIKSLPVLRTDGAFDPAKYSAFLQNQLAPRGYTERQMEEVIRDSLRATEIRRVIVSPVAVGEAQVREAARIYQPVAAQVIRFEREAFLKDKAVAVAKEEVEAFYLKNREGLGSPEQRSVAYAVLELSPDQRKTEGKERTTVLQKLADRAVDAGKSLREGIAKGGDFFKIAAKSGLQTRSASSLERDGAQPGKDSVAPRAVVAAAFRLQKAGDVSDIIQDGSIFYIVMVTGITPARQLELADVSDKILTLLRNEKASKAAAEAAALSLDRIQKALSAGTPFAEAVRQAGVKTQKISGITPADSKNSPEQQAEASATLSLKEGEIGPLQPAPWGAFAVYLEKRTPLSPEQWKEHAPVLSKTILSNEQDLLFSEWLRESRLTAGIKMLGGARGGR